MENLCECGEPLVQNPRIMASVWWSRQWRIGLVLELGQIPDDELRDTASKRQRGSEWWSDMAAAEIRRREELET